DVAVAELIGGELLRQPVEVVLRIGARAGDRTHVHQRGHLTDAEQLDELLYRARRVADGADRQRVWQSPTLPRRRTGRGTASARRPAGTMRWPRPTAPRRLPCRRGSRGRRAARSPATARRE